MLLNDIKDLVEMHQVFFKCFTVNQDIIDKDQHPISEQRLKNCVHEGLKRCGGVGEPKGPDPEFPMPLVSVDNQKCPKHIMDSAIIFLSSIRSANIFGSSHLKPGRRNNISGVLALLEPARLVPKLVWPSSSNT